MCDSKIRKYIKKKKFLFCQILYFIFINLFSQKYTIKYGNIQGQTVIIVNIISLFSLDIYECIKIGHYGRYIYLLFLVLESKIETIFLK